MPFADDTLDNFGRALSKVRSAEDRSLDSVLLEYIEQSMCPDGRDTDLLLDGQVYTMLLRYIKLLYIEAKKDTMRL